MFQKLSVLFPSKSGVDGSLHCLYQLRHVLPGFTVVPTDTAILAFSTDPLLGIVICRGGIVLLLAFDVVAWRRSGAKEGVSGGVEVKDASSVLMKLSAVPSPVQLSELS